jgi:2,3-diketo-5-methylthio-1-phosphopentane phosphatase
MIRLSERRVDVVLLDIEGTTTPIEFVHDVLLPFAQVHLARYLDDRRHVRRIAEVFDLLSEEHADDVASGSFPPPRQFDDEGERRAWMAAYARWLMGLDRKSPGLKLLQGHIWEEGYQAGLLHGLVFDDVPDALRRWSTAGVEIAIYSSGSELAQRRLFESTRHGDLTSLLARFFDTRVGPKVETASYLKIAADLGRQTASMLFISDVTAELEAARTAGLQVLLSLRPGNRPQPSADRFEPVHSFDQIGV